MALLREGASRLPRPAFANQRSRRGSVATQKSVWTNTQSYGRALIASKCDARFSSIAPLTRERMARDGGCGVENGHTVTDWATAVPHGTTRGRVALYPTPPPRQQYAYRRQISSASTSGARPRSTGARPRYRGNTLPANHLRQLPVRRRVLGDYLGCERFPVHRDPRPAHLVPSHGCPTPASCTTLLSQGRPRARASSAGIRAASGPMRMPAR